MVPKKKVRIKVQLSKEERKRINALLKKYDQPIRESVFQYGRVIKIPKTYLYE